MSNVLMPQMGESVAEGTIVRWIKRVGDLVDKDEPLFEISTDRSTRKSRRPMRARCSRSACRKARPFRSTPSSP
jgi:2-oxoglutarate dehydrogenase E2 component (dihydrolipoamide succinyltransferase)